jgi:hypothetical protein
MSTLCRAGTRWQKYAGAETSAPKAFGVLPNFSAFLKWVKEGRKISDNPKIFGNISDKQPFSEKISDYFLGGVRLSRSLCGASRRTSGQRQVKVSQTSAGFDGVSLYQAKSYANTS